jgi:predicted DNA binding CopG/RHH family protein
MKETKLPEKLRRSLAVEALEWDEKARMETENSACKEIENAEIFNVTRPPRRPVSVRLDLREITLLKRFSRRRGIPYFQLIAQWLHERVETECRSEH